MSKEGLVMVLRRIPLLGVLLLVVVASICGVALVARATQ
jgi:hypothetical protein